MFLGTGNLEVRLMNPNGVLVEIIVPARPVARPFEDFEDVVVSLGRDVYSEEVEVVTGVKFRSVVQWVSHSLNQTEMAQIRKIQNWRGAGRFVNLWPHEDQPQLQLRCDVHKVPTSPVNGKVNADLMEIEFRGLDTLERMANPLYDRVGRLFRRGSVTTTSKVFGIS